MIPASPSQSRRSTLLVFCCTLIGAAAQVLIKTGATALGKNPSLVATAIGILTTPQLFAGYSLYATKIGGIALIVAGVAALGRGTRK